MLFNILKATSFKYDLKLFKLNMKNVGEKRVKCDKSVLLHEMRTFKNPSGEWTPTSGRLVSLFLATCNLVSSLHWYSCRGNQGKLLEVKFISDNLVRWPNSAGTSSSLLSSTLRCWSLLNLMGETGLYLCV